jgi:hypothetical protein
MVKRNSGLLVGAVLAAMGAGGCIPYGIDFPTPIPIPPWVTERMEEKYNFKNDHRTPIMPPIPDGYRPFCEDPPDLAMVLRAMPHVTRGLPYVYEEFRDDISYTYERLKDAIDPPRFFPLVGPAQLHHCHWKCTVFYTETVESGYPFPVKLTRRRVEVVYIDKDHLHLVACTPEVQQSFTHDLVGYLPASP